MMKEDQEQIRL